MNAGRDVDIIHRDDHWLVLNKPAWMPTTDPDDNRIALTRVARIIDPSASFLHPVSRLDAPVTGIVIFARSPKANNFVLECRKQGTFRRTYVGLSEKVPLPSTGSWTASIAIRATNPKLREAYISVDYNTHKPAHTLYSVLQQLPQVGALLTLSPQTGRTHQLRVHAAHAGCPLLGDVDYGGIKRVTLANGQIVTARRVMLHSTYVEMPNIDEPSKRLVFQCVAPADMIDVWTRLGGDPHELVWPIDPV